MPLELLAWSFSIRAAAKLGGCAFCRRRFDAELQQLLDLVKIFKLRLEIRTLSFNLTLPGFEPTVSRWHKPKIIQCYFFVVIACLKIRLDGFD